MNDSQAREFADQWIAAWNSHDLDRVLVHYRDDVEVTSPFVESVLGKGRLSVIGKPALREYWQKALDKYADLHFVMIEAYPGVDSIVIVYHGVADRIGAEFMQLDANAKVCRMHAHYVIDKSAPSRINRR